MRFLRNWRSLAAQFGFDEVGVRGLRQPVRASAAANPRTTSRAHGRERPPKRSEGGGATSVIALRRRRPSRAQPVVTVGTGIGIRSITESTRPYSMASWAGHEVVAVGVAFDPLQRLARVLGEQIVQHLLGPQKLLGVDQDLGRRALGARQRLVDHDPARAAGRCACPWCRPPAAPRPCWRPGRCSRWPRRR